MSPLPHTFAVVLTEWGSTKDAAAYVLNQFATDLKAEISKDRTELRKWNRCLLKVCDFVNIEEWLGLSDDDLMKRRVVFFCATAEAGQVPSGSRALFDELKEVAYDHREDGRRGRFGKLEYQVVAIGDKSYGGENYCQAGIQLSRILFALGAKRRQKIAFIDRSRECLLVPDSIRQSLDWLIVEIRQKLRLLRSEAERCVDGRIEGECCRLRSSSESEVEESDCASEQLVEDYSEASSIEDLDGEDSVELLTKSQRKVLEGQNYRLVGGHSAVKLCRWTKHQLRDRGGCYKHSFYGIQSHQCMEATCSLACANKCVFCWRHHKNPVSKEWKWKIDEPKDIVEDCLTQQLGLLKVVRGIAKPERHAESLQVRHCALSLVGEPIMYPKISELIDQLHSRRISTFLVTNGQFPQQMINLAPCTQLYVSVDAADPFTMKRIDRPLFKDYWERFEECLRLLKDRQERTVYRLTLVKEQNIADSGGYAELVKLGHPDLIELKGVTFSGPSLTSGIRMTNVPLHEEVIEFGKELKKHLDKISLADSEFPRYEIALEHSHSCSVLLAKTDFRDEMGIWHLWIDFDKFFPWAERVKAGDKTMKGLDYSIPVPPWALFGSKEEGFDPTHTRVRKQKGRPVYEG